MAVVLTLALCCSLTPFTDAADGVLSVRLFHNDNCNTPLNNSLYDIHSLAFPNEPGYVWHCMNDLSTPAVSSHWQLLRVLCTAAGVNS